MSGRAAAALAALTLTLAACSSTRELPDDNDRPPVGSLTVPTSTVPAFTEECDGTATNATDLAACLAASTTTPAVDPTEAEDVPGSTHGGDSPVEPPGTCGPDPDETHPPPCD